jgi:predicted Zn-dependent protease with MMP-like domain
VSRAAPPWLAPSAEDIARLGEAVLRDLPEPFRSAVAGVPVAVRDFADDEVLADLGIDDPFDLMGLYQGTPIGQAEARGTAQDVDMIFLYRRPLLDYWCEQEEDLAHLVRHVLIHEIGHHLGLSDEDMERIESEGAMR